MEEISISEKAKQRLDELKLTPDETYNSVIKRIMKNHVENYMEKE